MNKNKTLSRLVNFCFFLIFPLFLVSISLFIHSLLFKPIHHSLTCSILGLHCPNYNLDVRVNQTEYSTVARLFETFHKEGHEIKSCVAASVNGKTVIDACAGEPHLSRSFRDSLTILFSNSKTVYSILIAMMVDKGLISYNDEISKHWPEFGQRGKENITISDVLQHASDIPLLDGDESVTIEQLSDLDLIADRIANSIPVHIKEPSRKQSPKYSSPVAYHAITQGFILNEVVRRVDPLRRTIAQIIHEDVNPSLGTEIYMSLSADNHQSIIERIVPVYMFPTVSLVTRYISRLILHELIPNSRLLSMWIPPISNEQKYFFTQMGNKSSETYKAFFGTVNNMAFHFNQPSLYQNEMVAVTGVSNVHSLMTLGNAFINQSLFKNETTFEQAMTTNQPAYFDRVLGLNMQRTKGGFAVYRQFQKDYNITFYGWEGLGGSLFVFSPERQIVFTYLLNALEVGLTSHGGKGFALLEQFLKNHTQK